MSTANYKQIELSEVKSNESTAQQAAESSNSVAVDIDVEHSSSRFAAESRKRSMTFSPETPENSPSVLTFENISVATKTKPVKQLLRGLNGSITGGFWAIMGPSGGGKVSYLYYNICIF